MQQRLVGGKRIGNQFLSCKVNVPVHFFERKGSQQRLSSTRQFNGSDLTYPSLHFELDHAQDAAFVLSAIRGNHAHGPQVFELEQLNEFSGQCQFSGPRIHQHVTGDFAPLFFRW